MKNLIHFLIKYSVVFLFIILEIFSLILISHNKGYQRSVLLSSTNSVTGWMYEKSNNFYEFFKLKNANEKLSNENVALKNRITFLENQINAVTDNNENYDWKKIKISPEREYEYISAKVIKNTTHMINNFITLNKGEDDGIKPDMGVINENGVVGIVQSVSSKFAKVIPILNPQTVINAKFKSNNYYGPVVWDGKDYRYAKMEDIARHVTFSLGDTLITSGLVKTFPEGILIGTIDNYEIKESDAYYNIHVKLAVDFRMLTHVQVINYKNYQEQDKLEKDQLKSNEHK